MMTFTEYPIERRDNASAMRRVMPWSDFAAWLSTPVDSDDKHAQLWSPRDVETYGDRKHGPASCLVFEYDASASNALLGRAVSMLLRHEAVLHLSASAGPGNPRFRVVMRTDRPIANEHEYASCIAVVARWLGTHPDDSIISRGWYRPIRGCPTIVFDGAYVLTVDVATSLFPPAPAREDYATEWIEPAEPGAPDIAGWLRWLAPAPVDSTGGRLFSWMVAAKRGAWQHAVPLDLAWAVVDALLAASPVVEAERRRQWDNVEPGPASWGSLRPAKTAAEQLARLRGAVSR